MENTHTNQIAIDILREEYGDYDYNSWHYDQEYKMLIIAQTKAWEQANEVADAHDTKGDKIRKYINPCNHFIDWIVDNGQSQFNILYGKLEQYKIETYGNTDK